MDINKTLIEYGKLKTKLKELNKKISQLFEEENVNIETMDDYINNPQTHSQLSRFFDYWKEERKDQGPYDEDPFELEDWVCEVAQEELRPNSRKLLDFIEDRKIIRMDLGYKKASITKYAKKLAKESKNENN